MKAISLFLLLLFLTSLQHIGAQCYQEASGNKKLIKQYLGTQMYHCALKELLYIHARKPKDTKVMEQLVECYLNINEDKSKSIPHLEKLITQKKINPLHYLYLGQAYHFGERFNDAIEMLNKYLLTNPNKEEKFIAQKYIEYAHNAIELIKFPVQLTFENLGADINSEWDDYNPFVAPDEEFVIFTSTREKTIGNSEFLNGYLADLCMAQFRGNDFAKSRPMGGTYNTMDIDEFAGGSADGTTLFIATDFENFQIFNLKIAQKGPRSRNFPRPEFLSDINSKNTNELSATINNEGNLIIFSSDRAGGYGGHDLWMSKLLPDGTWGIPVNLGPEINTEMDELFPMFTHDQDGFIFSSSGHYSMGGLDLFVTTFSESLKTWTAPKNLGYPVNTPYNDYFISILPNGRHAYKSAWRKDSYGMQDLYRLTFLDSMPNYTVVEGTIKIDNHDVLQNYLTKEAELQEKLAALYAHQDYAKSTQLKTQYSNLNQELFQLRNNFIKDTPFKANIEVYNKNNGQLYGTYKPNILNGRFILLLEPGTYSIHIQQDNFNPIKEDLTIYDKKNFTPLLSKEFMFVE